MSAFRDALHEFVSRDLAEAARMAARLADVETTDEFLAALGPPQHDTCCNIPTCGCRDKAEIRTARAREEIIGDLDQIEDLVGGLPLADYATLNRAYQLVLRGDDIAGGKIIREVLERAMDERAEARA
jgi:hypothetical protein